MSDIKFNCPACGGHIAIDASAAGIAAKCPHCNAAILVPEVDASASKAGSGLRRARFWFASGIGLVVFAVVLFFCIFGSGGVRIREACVLDVVVVDSKSLHQLEAVMIAVLPSPPTEKLDLKEVVLVASDGTVFKTNDSDEQKPEGILIGTKHWIAFIVPGDYTNLGSLTLRYKNTNVSPLPARLAKRTLEELKRM